MLKAPYEAEAQSRALAEDLAKALYRARSEIEAAEAARDRAQAQARAAAAAAAQARASAEELAEAWTETNARPGGPDAVAPTPEDAFLQAAARRPPGDIAVVVAGLRVKGQAAFAARLVQETVRARSVADVTALALALLDADPTHASSAQPYIPAQSPPTAAQPARQRPVPLTGMGRARLKSASPRKRACGLGG
ncbi:hypothetical protein [Streptomyces sp. NPDC059918]|uniref:hypothetical protein n=1 Tax=unclassified Streptomyces TaxID=2593676 RepID=UPI00366731E9